MKRNPPTLADTCVATALSKRVYPGSEEGTKMIKDILRKVPYARKFVLDDNMSEFLAELHDGISRVDQRKRNVILENTTRRVILRSGLLCRWLPIRRRSTPQARVPSSPIASRTWAFRAL